MQINKTVCSECEPGSPPGCQGCSYSVGQPVLINCVFVGDCDPFSHPLLMIRITSSGRDEIMPDDIRGVMPGFVSLDRPTDCSLRLNFTATPAAHNVVIQCGVSTNEVMEYSLAEVIAIRGIKYFLIDSHSLF